MILPKTEFQVPVPDPLLVSPQASTLEQTLTLFPKLHQFVFTQVKVTFTPGGGGVLSLACVYERSEIKYCIWRRIFKQLLISRIFSPFFIIADRTI